jgi:hypothetical protein
MIFDHVQLNNLLAEKLQKNESFSLVRLDNTIGYAIDCITRNSRPISQFFNEQSLFEGGIYPNTMEFAYTKYIPGVVKQMEDCDILGFVDISGEISRNETILNLFGAKPMFFGNSICLLDPAGPLGVSFLGPVSNPWTQYLKGKKVLVISTHRESILHQWKNIDKIWGDKREIVAPFELVDCIRSPYHPYIDNRQYSNVASSTWFDSIDYIKKEIEKYDFDVLLSSSSSSSPFYANHARDLGKVGIQTGGSLQLFFGIHGYRWHDVDGYKAWHAMYNEHWMFPLKVDEPQKREEFKGLESNFAYWRA